MVQPKRKRKFNHRENQPEPIGRIIAKQFPELLENGTKVIHYPQRGIVSFQNEDGLPLEQVEALLNMSINSRKQNL